jgi:hypothetical protein
MVAPSPARCSLKWTPGFGDLSEKVFEPTAALLQGFDPKVDAAQFQQVEGVEGSRAIRRSTVAGTATGVVGNGRSSVEWRGPRVKLGRI